MARTTELDDKSDTEGAPPLSKGQQVLRILGWTFLSLFFLVFFTVMKLPSDRVKLWIDGQIASALAQRGIYFTAAKKSLSLFPGVTYRLKDFTLNFPPPAPAAHLDEISVSPALTGLLFNSVGGNAEIRNSEGTLRLATALKNLNQGKLQGNISFESKKMELGKTGLLTSTLGIQSSMALLDGDGTFKGDFSNPTSLEGKLSVRLTPLVIDAQSLQGFALPKLTISESQVNLSFERGKILIKDFKIGKPGSGKDDLQGTITGDITLGKDWLASMLNLKINFSLSDTAKKSFSLLEMLLGSYKQADGSFSIQLTGPAAAPTPSQVNGGTPS